MSKLPDTKQLDLSWLTYLTITQLSHSL